MSSRRLRIAEEADPLIRMSQSCLAFRRFSISAWQARSGANFWTGHAQALEQPSLRPQMGSDQ